MAATNRQDLADSTFNQRHKLGKQEDEVTSFNGTLTGTWSNFNCPVSSFP
jgi:hypothetical protein